MSFLGMGTLEVLVILVVAFIFLGPERMVDAARMLGRFVREARRMASELPSLDMDESRQGVRRSPIVHRGGGPGPQASGNGQEPSPGEPEYKAEADGPVAHQRVARPAPQAEPDSPARQAES